VTGHMNPYLRPAMAQSPDVLDGEVSWGSGFDFWGNVNNFLRSARGEKVVQMILITFTGCFVLQTVVGLFFRMITSAEKYNSFPVRDQWFLGQKVPSTLHAIGVSIFAFKIIFIDQIFENDLTSGYSTLCDVTMAYSFGYEIYDILIMYIQTGASTPMYIHHLSLCIAFLMSASHKKEAFVAIAMLPTELTVLPGNLHWYLKLYGLKKTRLFHFNQGLRLWSFVLLRLPVPSYVWYLVYKHYDIFQYEHAIARWAVYLIVGLLSLMNLYWTYMMSTLYMKRTTLVQQLAKENVALKAPPTRVSGEKKKSQ